MKRSVFAISVYSIIKVLLVVLLFALPQAATISLWIKIIFTILMLVDIIIDILTLGNCMEIVKTCEEKANYKWKDRKRTFLGLPWSFTKYRVTKEKLIVKKGFFNISESEMRLYRITDLDLDRRFGERLFGLGTITVHSSDKSDQILKLERIKRSEYVKELISDLVEEERIKKRVSGREIIDSRPDDIMHDDEVENIVCACEHTEE